MKIQMGSFSIPRSLPYIPYSSAVLESYVKNRDDPPACEFLEPIYKYDDIPDPECEILGLTCYVWSQDHVDQIAKDHKEKYPNCTITH
jgi:hypothetical protein